MTNPKRSRGRPRGSTSWKEKDAATLEKMAGLMVDASPSIKPTTAMQKLCIHNRSDHKRLMRKWTSTGVQLMNAERERRRPQPQRPATVTSIPFCPDYFVQSTRSSSAIAQMEKYIDQAYGASQLNSIAMRRTMIEEQETDRLASFSLTRAMLERSSYVDQEMKRIEEQRRLMSGFDRQMSILEEVERRRRLMEQIDRQERVRRLVERSVHGRYGF